MFICIWFGQHSLLEYFEWDCTLQFIIINVSIIYELIYIKVLKIVPDIYGKFFGLFTFISYFQQSVLFHT